jgi:hypothetical protein
MRAVHGSVPAYLKQGGAVLDGAAAAGGDAQLWATAFFARRLAIRRPVVTPPAKTARSQI